MMRELSFGKLVFVWELITFAGFCTKEGGSDDCESERKRQNNRYITNKL
jgi:hypothetical protein